jgi:outer membrane protein assembly factor BamB
MMPAEFAENKQVNFTLDNYRAPLIVDDRVYLFYEGATILNASNGKELERDKFKVNEGGLALTEADPVLDDRFIYVSGRGRVRAIDRQSGKTVWKSDDLGVTSEMYWVGQRLFVKTGGQFTRLKDGETEEKGPFGITAIDTKNGKTIWRYKGADKGITNFVFRDAGTIVLADRDDLILLNAENGKRITKTDHKIEKAQFVMINERGEAVVGGREEISGFGQTAGRPRVSSGAQGELSRIWTAKHKAPGRGVFRIVAAIALRATALYFRYGGIATSAFSFARSGINLANTVASFRVSGLQSRFGAANLSTLASNYAKNYVSNQVRLFGAASRIQNFDGLRIQRPNLAARLTPSREDIQERLFDRLDPTRQLEKLSDYLLKRKRMAELRGSFMYFYTDLPKPFDSNGLVGVNVHNGQSTRLILVPDPDSRFLTDEATGALYSVRGSQLQAFDIFSR